ncbi:MAG: DUF1772 domain-containing protein [Actinomycetota bacterium]
MPPSTPIVLRSLSRLFIVTNAAVYAFLAVAIVPYWQTLSGDEIQAWFADHFGRFATMMVPVHLLAITTTIAAAVTNRHRLRAEAGLWGMVLVGLLASQAFNFTLFAVVLNPDLSSQTLTPTDAIDTLDDWDTWHTVRTLLVLASAAAIVTLTTRTAGSSVVASEASDPSGRHQPSS